MAVGARGSANKPEPMRLFVSSKQILWIFREVRAIFVVSEDLFGKVGDGKRDKRRHHPFNQAWVGRQPDRLLGNLGQFLDQFGVFLGDFQKLAHLRAGLGFATFIS